MRDCPPVPQNCGKAISRIGHLQNRNHLKQLPEITSAGQEPSLAKTGLYLESFFTIK